MSMKRRAIKHAVSEMRTFLWVNGAKAKRIFRRRYDEITIITVDTTDGRRAGIAVVF